MSVISKILPFKQGKDTSIGSVPPDMVALSIEACQGYSKSRLKYAESKARMWMLVGLSGITIGVVGLVSVLMILPLVGRTVDHFWGPNQAGVFQQLPDFNEAVKKMPHAFDAYFAERYVCARESWQSDRAEEERAVVSWSTGHDDLQDYLHDTDPKNPNAPVHEPGINGKITCDVASDDTYFNKETGRYVSNLTIQKRTQKFGTPRTPAETWKADFTWEKHPDAVPAYARKYNPIGMTVIHYHAQKVQ